MEFEKLRKVWLIIALIIRCLKKAEEIVGDILCYFDDENTDKND